MSRVDLDRRPCGNRRIVLIPEVILELDSRFRVSGSTASSSCGAASSWSRRWSCGLGRDNNSSESSANVTREGRKGGDCNLLPEDVDNRLLKGMDSERRTRAKRLGLSRIDAESSGSMVWSSRSGNGVV